MPGWPKSTPPLDLDRYSEDTRRRLYDHLRSMRFFVAGLDHADKDPLPYSAEEAGLTILWLWGRWVAVWTRLEVENYRPEADRFEVLRIKPSTENDLGIVLHER
jgi:hypothetical protein